MYFELTEDQHTFSSRNPSKVVHAYHFQAIAATIAIDVLNFAVAIPTSGGNTKSKFKISKRLNSTWP